MADRIALLIQDNSPPSKHMLHRKISIQHIPQAHNLHGNKRHKLSTTSSVGPPTSQFNSFASPKATTSTISMLIANLTFFLL